ncbi:SDR family NAD(P)-dependent oxidoreductase [Aequorivita viscosa]|uniref:NAD(P)-dependent dehydrogenase, short-chain alcohol dehydrogenase family n=1 Tax=Aequorivita viscosa TaxID=797419 RepID=A0A1M6DMH6_9FLAO|nr:SDR family NAD(P)-dependent oxidoreductase [Aequorivita viscosa]SDW50951.1 NAD(P)-dependent dehydrogenase, short-chain alcohol dehydrogenase family [Aequorivita viscosa]SHI74517.1 NAD(P)-dependent dehydrogenase, short-chain alcohol dehydrogenase family [Aequorivita viscosa]
MKNLEGQVIIVTGRAAGIGGAMTSELTERGASIIEVDLNEDAGKEKEASHPEKIAFLKGDVSKESVANEAVALAVSKFGKLTGLVNNAHASRQKPLMGLTEDDWALSMNTGLNGTLNFMKAAYPELKKTKGSIVNFGSGAGLLGQKNQGSYAAAKEAIRGLSRVAANEWAEEGIRANVVCPLAFTDGVKQWKENFPEQYEEIISKNPMQRFGDPQEDVAPIVAFLLSSDSQYMTGQTLMADGGDIKLR